MRLYIHEGDLKMTIVSMPPPLDPERLDRMIAHAVAHPQQPAGILGAAPARPAAAVALVLVLAVLSWWGVTAGGGITSPEVVDVAADFSDMMLDDFIDDLV
jgi:hypothetical protein